MGTLAVAVSVAVINIILWIVFFIRFRKTFSPQNILHEIGAEVDKLCTEIDRTADMDLQLIDAKLDEIRKLLIVVDERLDLLKLENSKRGRPEVQDRKTVFAADNIAQNIADVVQVSPEAAQNAYSRMQNSLRENSLSERVSVPENRMSAESARGIPENGAALQRQQEVAGRRDAEAVFAEPEVAESAVPEVQESKPMLRTRILDLWRAGLSAQEISERLETPVDIVQMTLSMFSG